MDETCSDRPARRLFRFRIGPLLFIGMHADGEGWGLDPDKPRRVRLGWFRSEEAIGLILGEVAVGVGIL